MTVETMQHAPSSDQGIIVEVKGQDQNVKVNELILAVNATLSAMRMVIVGDVIDVENAKQQLEVRG